MRIMTSRLFTFPFSKESSTQNPSATHQITSILYVSEVENAAISALNAKWRGTYYDEFSSSLRCDIPENLYLYNFFMLLI